MAETTTIDQNLLTTPIDGDEKDKLNNANIGDSDIKIEDAVPLVKPNDLINNNDKTPPMEMNNGSGGCKPNNDDEDGDDEDYEDETIVERLIGLTEMFPESVRNLAYNLTSGSFSLGKGMYDFGRSAMWIISTSAIILAAPSVIESEKSQLEEMNRQQQRQILLGPSASAVSSLTPTLTPPPAIK